MTCRVTPRRIAAAAVLASLLAAGTACTRNTNPPSSLTDRISAEIGDMNGAQAEADRRADAWRRALRDPSLAFRDSSAVALASAAAAGNAALVRDLVAHGARLDVRGVNDLTLLQWEILHGSASGVAALLVAGADPSQRGLDGKTAVSTAAQDIDPVFLRILLRHRADPNAADADGSPPLFAALLIDPDNRESCDMLLRAGADVNRADSLGNTPLDEAAMTNNYARVLQFLQLGANPRATNRIGTFQVYLPSGAELGNENADAKGRLDDIDAWLGAHRVPIDRNRTSPQRS